MKSSKNGVKSTMTISYLVNSVEVSDPCKFQKYLNTRSSISNVVALWGFFASAFYGSIITGNFNKATN